MPKSKMRGRMEIAGDNILQNESQISSLDVAKLFVRQHGKVLKTIRSVECDQEFLKKNFQAAIYQDKSGRKLPYFLLTSAGFNFLIMHFSGKKARAIRSELLASSISVLFQPEKESQI